MSALAKCCRPKSLELQRLENAFNKLDVDNIGAIPLRQLHRAIGTVDVGRELDNEQRRVLLIKADRDRDGYIGFDEFVRLMQQPVTADGSRLEKIVFRTADVVTARHHRRDVYGYLKEYSCRPPPLFMLCMSVCQVAVFLGYSLSTGLAPGWLHGCPGCRVKGRVGPLVYQPQLKKEAWRYVTYMFIHAGIEHLLGNLMLQLILGIPLELVHKLWRIGPLYIGGVLLGSLLQSAADPNVALVGASGGCYALLTAHLANVILNWSEMPWRWVRVLVVASFIISDVSFAAYRRYYLGECVRVSYMAHVGGAAAGLLLGMVLLRNVRVLKWEKALSWVCLVMFIALLLACIVLNVAFNPGDHAVFTTRCFISNSTK